MTSTDVVVVIWSGLAQIPFSLSSLIVSYGVAVCKAQGMKWTRSKKVVLTSVAASS